MKWDKKLPRSEINLTFKERIRKNIYLIAIIKHINCPRTKLRLK
jgi:hypothetical protein